MLFLLNKAELYRLCEEDLAEGTIGLVTEDDSVMGITIDSLYFSAIKGVCNGLKMLFYFEF